MTKKSHAKIADIAKKLKVSNVTVSKALRGHPDISVETAKKIKKLAVEMGYVPNLMARNLSARQSNTIGVVVPKIAHFFFSTVIEAIYDAAFENQYEIILTVSQESAEREAKHIQTLLSMRVDGIIVSVSQQTEDLAIFETVVKRGVPLTFMDRVMNVKGSNTVIADDHGGAFAATEQAIKVGYRKLAHIGGPLHTSIGKYRLAGFKDALKQHDLRVDPYYIINGGFGEEDGYRAFMKWYGTGHLPECIFSVNYPVALGVYTAAKELGLTIPKDFDIVAFGHSPLNKFLTPQMTYVDQPTSNLGRVAVELTLENIKNLKEFKPKQIQLPTKLILEETCRGKNEKSRA
ncbi:MAG: LacI family transcriptional regulator [Ignavibacteriae bacterium]|nr:LacI family transcriptional regulator [Ignavibacteriota bacterium]